MREKKIGFFFRKIDEIISMSVFAEIVAIDYIIN